MGFVGSARKLIGQYGRKAIGTTAAISMGARKGSKKGGKGKGKAKVARKSKGKRGRSYTKTFRIAETEMEGISVHNDMIQTSMNMHLGKYKKLKSYGKFEYQEVEDAILFGLEGRQKVDWLMQFMNYDQIMGNTGGNLFDKLGTDLYTLNPYRLPTGSAVIGSGNYDNDALYIDHIIGHFHFSNLTPIAAQLDLFFMTPKVDTDLDPRTAWSQLLVDNRMGQTASAYRTATTQAEALDGSALYNMVGQSPFQIKEFKKMYYSIGYKKIMLQPGEQNVVKFKINFGHIVRRAFVKERGSKFLRGLSVVPLLIQRGGIVEIMDTTTKGMTYAQTNIGVICNAKYVLKNPPIDRFSNFRSSYQVVANDAPGTAHANITTTDLKEFTVNAVDAFITNKQT